MTRPTTSSCRSSSPASRSRASGSINHTLAELQTIVRQSRAGWRIPLEHMKGVYVIHDQLTGEPYLGFLFPSHGDPDSGFILGAPGLLLVIVNPCW